jgi:CRP-like cAMP-binding protein
MLSMIDKKLRANTARAKEDCELALLDERTFRVMVEETPGFVWHVSTSSQCAFERPMRCCNRRRQTT